MNAKVTMGIRILFGVFLLVFGLNKFIGFMQFPEIPGDGGTLMGIYMSSGFMTIIGVLEIVCGVLLLVGKFVPLALTIASAIMLNAFLFHALHDPKNLAGAILGCILSIILVYAYRDGFKGTFTA